MLDAEVAQKTHEQCENSNADDARTQRFGPGRLETAQTVWFLDFQKLRDANAYSNQRQRRSEPCKESSLVGHLQLVCNLVETEIAQRT